MNWCRMCASLAPLDQSSHVSMVSISFVWICKTGLTYFLTPQWPCRIFLLISFGRDFRNYKSPAQHVRLITFDWLIYIADISLLAVIRIKCKYFVFVSMDGWRHTCCLIGFSICFMSAVLW